MAPKRDKGQTFSLADFTKAADNAGAWADEDVDLPTAPLALGEERPSYDNRPGRVPPRRLGRDEAPLPVAIDQRSLPREPPFMAFVGNLTYDATEEDIRSFFAGIEMKGVRFPRPSEGGARGFCYAEFLSVEGLTEALMKSGQSISGRPCRIDVATAKREDRDTKIVSGDWRTGHQVVECASSAPVMTRAGPRIPAAPLGNWRDSARPVEASLPVQTEPTIEHPTRPNFKLLPRTAPVATSEEEKLAKEVYIKSSKPNPFGSAKPREVVLSEKVSEDSH